MSRRMNIEREKFEHSIIEMVHDIEDNKNCDVSNENQTSIVQKFQIDLIKELWSNVITTKCPHC